MDGKDERRLVLMFLVLAGVADSNGRLRLLLLNEGRRWVLAVKVKLLFPFQPVSWTTRCSGIFLPSISLQRSLKIGLDRSLYMHKVSKT